MCIRDSFMVKAPDDVMLEVFEAGADRDPRVQAYYGLGDGQ